MSRETLLLFQQLLNGLTLNVGASDFEEAAARVLKARGELLAALEETE